MSRALLKGLFLFLALLALVAAPVTRAAAHAPTVGCATSLVAAGMASGYAAATGGMGSHDCGAATASATDCTTGCLASVPFTAPAVVTTLFAGAIVHLADLPLALVGLAPEPELGPPIG